MGTSVSLKNRFAGQLITCIQLTCTLESYISACVMYAYTLLMQRPYMYISACLCSGYNIELMVRRQDQEAMQELVQERLRGI